jgi:ABC-type transport system involved in cytochrome bd biosynthesis fused ATPase/permease subunit
MEWTRLAGAVGVLAVVVTALGAFASLVLSDLFASSFAIAAGVTLVVVAVAVVAMVAVGRRSGRWVSNPSSYW